jgi:hypothetical protein
MEFVTHSADLHGSLVHLHLNRLLGADRATERRVYGLLERLQHGLTLHKLWLNSPFAGAGCGSPVGGIATFDYRAAALRRSLPGAVTPGIPRSLYRARRRAVCIAVSLVVTSFIKNKSGDEPRPPAGEPRSGRLSDVAAGAHVVVTGSTAGAAAATARLSPGAPAVRLLNVDISVSTGPIIRAMSTPQNTDELTVAP